jgi:hypothetical protein
MMDDLRIYNYALTDQEIKDLYTAIANNKAVVGMQEKLVASYNFDGDLNDSSGYNNNGTAVGTITYGLGKAGKGTNSDAAKFDEKSSIVVEDSDSLDVDKEFTFAAWVNIDKTSTSNFSPIFTKGNTETQGRPVPYTYLVSNNSDGLGYPGTKLVDMKEAYPRSINSTSQIKRGIWTFLTVTYDGTNETYYIDGVKKDSQTWKGIVAHSKDKLVIGCNIVGGTKYFKGSMDEVKIYNYALSPKEISQLYRQKDTITTSPSIHTSMAVGNAQAVKVYFNPLRGSKSDITTKATYTSSNKKVATISKGKIVAKKAGSATLIIRYRNTTLTVSVSVR